MNYLPLDLVLELEFECLSPSTGENVAADSTPTFSFFESSTDTPMASGNFTQRTGHTGKYRGAQALSTAQGFEVGKQYHVYRNLTVEALTTSVLMFSFRLAPAEAGAAVPKVDVAYAAGVGPLVPSSSVVNNIGAP